MFFWSSSEDSKLAELFRNGRPSDRRRDADDADPAVDDESAELVVSFASFPRLPYLFYKEKIAFLFSLKGFLV